MTTTVTQPEAPETEAEGAYDFDPSFQIKIASLFTRDTIFADQTKDLIKPEYFAEAAVGTLVRIVQNHFQAHRAVPDLKILPQLIRDEKAAGRLRPDMLDPLKEVIGKVMKTDLSNPSFVSSKVADFAKHQAIEQAIMSSLPLLEKGRFDAIGELMRSAVQVGITADGDDYDYFAEIENRSQERQDLLAGKIVRQGITTGYSAIDALLYHYGWGRQELSCIMGPAKAGKSMSLGDFAKNASLAGHNVFYDSLEVSKKIIAERIDANLASVMMKNLNKDWKQVEDEIKKAHARAGMLLLKDHASGTLKPSTLLRQIEKYRADGIPLDLVVVDYADIMAAEYRSDNLQENLRSIYIDLRAIAHETNTAMLTATQTNRDGAKAHTAKATDVGDDWNKARTVDIMIGIAGTEQEKQKGEARLSWLLSRNTEDGFSILVKQDRSKMQFIKQVIGRV